MRTNGDDVVKLVEASGSEGRNSRQARAARVAALHGQAIGEVRRSLVPRSQSPFPSLTAQNTAEKF